MRWHPSSSFVTMFQWELPGFDKERERGFHYRCHSPWLGELHCADGRSDASSSHSPTNNGGDHRISSRFEGCASRPSTLPLDRVYRRRSAKRVSPQWLERHTNAVFSLARFGRRLSADCSPIDLPARNAVYGDLAGIGPLYDSPRTNQQAGEALYTTMKD